ncbi:BglG family transcription antiterminator [Clostridium polynesiense]|uniref:BglG family transcription antiterminator n=1 Tax=Clostridium polynesiense TaxID=1325933 RepID=UPI00058C698B|nr:BglG family transcription antiterminator [Clostridium polynesiense]
MKSLHKNYKIIVNRLMEEKRPVTSKELSILVGVSIRTVKNYINEINGILASYNVLINSKPREGYWIEIREDSDLEGLEKILDNKSLETAKNIPIYNYERISYLIKKLLVVDYHIKMDDLMEEIYVSRSTLTQDLKEVRKLLAAYRLKLVTRSNYGIIIEGEETDKRLCIAEYFFHYNLGNNYNIANADIFTNEKSRDEYDYIYSFLQEIISKYNISMSDFSLNNLTIHIIVSIRRCILYNYIKIQEPIGEEVLDSKEFKAAVEITQRLQDYYQLILPIGETLYYSIHLKSKRIFEENNIDNKDKLKLNQCMDLILQEVKSNFDISFYEDKQFYDYMYLHLWQMVERIKNNMFIRNPLARDNMRRYLFAAKITYSACNIIEKFYNIKIDINEFGYLLLYFNLALYNYDKSKKVRIYFISGRGRPESAMYYNEIKEAFNGEKYELELLDSTNDIEPSVGSSNLLVSTYKIEKPLPFPLMVIKDDNYIEEIRKALKDLSVIDIDFNKYFKEENCCFSFPGNNKDEVIKNLYKKLLELGYIEHLPEKEDYFANNEIGNGIVHFQDLHRICRKGFFFIAVLEKPILWEKEVVKVIFILKTKRDGDKDLYTLCRIMSKWANDPKKVDALIEGADFYAFLEEIKKL